MPQVKIHVRQEQTEYLEVFLNIWCVVCVSVCNNRKEQV